MSSINNHWKLIKTVLPQHTDHAGVMWHGSYLNFLEEGRIDALDKVGLSYSRVSTFNFQLCLTHFTEQPSEHFVNLPPIWSQLFSQTFTILLSFL